MSKVSNPTSLLFKEYVRSHVAPVEDEKIKAMGRWSLSTPLRKPTYEHPLLNDIPSVTGLEVATLRLQPKEPLFEAQQMKLLGLSSLTDLVTIYRGPDWNFSVSDGWGDAGELGQHDVAQLMHTIAEVDRQPNGLVVVSLGAAAMASV